MHYDVISLLQFHYSHVSGITFLGVPADVFRYGASYWLVVISMAILPFFAVYIYLPAYFNLQITSTYEYLEMRFNSRTRSLASFIFAVAMLLYLPIVIYIPSLAVAAGMYRRLLDLHSIIQQSVSYWIWSALYYTYNLQHLYFLYNNWRS